jgi:hypothetical protein
MKVLREKNHPPAMNLTVHILCLKVVAVMKMYSTLYEADWLECIPLHAHPGPLYFPEKSIESA